MKATAFFLLSTLAVAVQGIDCFGWSVTRRVNYLEVVPMLLYFDHVDWINLDPGYTCTFRTNQAVFLQLYSSNLTASYQEYKYSDDFVCALNTTQVAQKFANQTWHYSNDALSADPKVCGYLVTIQNKDVRKANMFQVIRTGAELLKQSLLLITAAVSALYILI